jgi:hypothetical protein
MKNFHCTNCEQIVFFENVRCESCGCALGFIPAEQEMAAFETRSDKEWVRLGKAPATFHPCHNYAIDNVCNWMIAADDPRERCESCRFTEVIPSLSKPENKFYWFQLEKAKRRLIYTLNEMHLPLPDRTQDPENGLSFRFLEDAPQERVLTGHEHGVITLNVAEADDAKREQTRAKMHEPYRTLLGHFRHEIGHFYWDQLIAGSKHLEPFRALFGDETLDYATALKTHYEQGPAEDWPASYISAYAASHPWEDWAETWAHYLHMISALSTAEAWGFALRPSQPNEAPAFIAKVSTETSSFNRLLLKQWLPLAQFLNSMNRSLGHADSYPFKMTEPVMQKLKFVHEVVGAFKKEA